jgi:hypothetical protein
MNFTETQPQLSEDRSLIYGLALAALVHLLLLSISIRFSLPESINLDQPILSLTLLKQKEVALDPPIEQLPLPTNSELSTNVESSTIPDDDQSVLNEISIQSDEPVVRSPVFRLPSPQQMRDLTNRIERERSLRNDKVDISQPRKGSHAQVYEEKRTTERKNDPIADTRVSSPNGVIRKSKVNGRVFCSISIARGAAFNGLTPYRTGVAGFSCDNPDKSNKFLDKEGRIANSDREEWLE